MKNCKNCIINKIRWKCETCKHSFCEKCLNIDQKGFYIKCYCKNCFKDILEFKKRDNAARIIQRNWTRNKWELL